MTRKASEILLELERTVNNLSKTVNNLDNNIKIVLQRLNKKADVKPASVPAPKPVASDKGKTVPFSELPKTNVFEQMKAEAGLSEASENELQTSNRRGQRAKTTPGKRVVVSQEVQTQIGGPVFLANIEILTEDGDLVHQGRTNNKGKWSMPLEPGSYKVNVVKRRKEGANIQTSYMIQVPEDLKKFELPPQVLL